MDLLAHVYPRVLQREKRRRRRRWERMRDQEIKQTIQKLVRQYRGDVTWALLERHFATALQGPPSRTFMSRLYRLVDAADTSPNSMDPLAEARRWLIESLPEEQRAAVAPPPRQTAAAAAAPGQQTPAGIDQVFVAPPSSALQTTLGPSGHGSTQIQRVTALSAPERPVVVDIPPPVVTLPGSRHHAPHRGPAAAPAPAAAADADEDFFSLDWSQLPVNPRQQLDRAPW